MKLPIFRSIRPGSGVNIKDRFFFENSSDLCFVLKNSGKILKVNNSVLNLLGFSAQELTEQSFLFITHPQHHEVANQLFTGEKGTKQSITIRIRNKSDVYVVYNADFYFSNDNSNFLLLKTSSGLRNSGEELSLKNRELEEAKAIDDAMLENIGDGVIGVNDKGEIVLVNKKAEEMLGYKAEELKGKLMFHAIEVSDEKGNVIPINVHPSHKALLTKAHIYSREWFYKRKDGTRFPVYISANPVVLFDKVIGGIDVFRDITREKEVENMKTEFISLASHQLRTPLSAMKWLLEILINGDIGQLTEEQVKIAKEVYSSNQRMIELVNDLLNISRIESGRIVIDPKSTEIGHLIEDVVKELQPKILEKKLVVKVDVQKDIGQIFVDPQLIRNAFMNIVVNSIKYTPEGGSVEIYVAKEVAEMVFRVKDSGYGIPQDQKDKVFEKFLDSVCYICRHFGLKNQSFNFFRGVFDGVHFLVIDRV